MVRLFGAHPFESETLDMLAECMEATPILKRKKFLRYYKVNRLLVGCLSYPDVIFFDAKYYDVLLHDELLAVGAHELNHIAEKHAVKKIKRLLLPAVVLSAAVGCLVTVFSSFFYVISLSINFDGYLFIPLATVLSLLLGIIVTFYVNASWLRQLESESDLSAVKFGKGEAMMSALIKFRNLRHIKENSRGSKLSRLFPQTYPAFEQRINDIKLAMAKNPIEPA